MIELLLATPSRTPSAPTSEIAFGGSASLPEGTQHPSCSYCGLGMLFLGQLPSRTPGHLIALFQCVGPDPDGGVCPTWDPESGANATLIFPTAGLWSPPRPHLRVDTSVRYGARIEAYADADDYWLLRDDVDDHGDVVGQWHGTPDWIRDDQTPECDICGTPMLFVAQLDEGHDDPVTGLSPYVDFGTGEAYVFENACEHLGAKHLWQS
jgi:hypothetical protein